jgi:hypothetical protein
MPSSKQDTSRVVAVRVDSSTFKALRYLAVDRDKTVSALLREEAERLTVPNTAEGRLISRMS